MSKSAYSDLKAVWHQDKIRSLRQGRQVVPAQVQLIISDLCNHDCHFCAYRMSGGFSTEQFAEGGNKNPARMIPFDKCKEILDDCAALGVKSIQFTGGGEPTVHKDHMDIFRYALSLGLECGLVTNGALLRPGWGEVLPQFKWVRVSVDAGTEETYATVRSIKPSAFHTVLANIRDISEAIMLHGSECLLGVGFVITLENYHEVVAACRRFRAIGAPYVRLSAMFSNEGSRYYNGAFNDIVTEIRAAKELETDRFKVVDLFGERIEDLDQGKPRQPFCGYQQFNCYIGGNQKVYRCCTTSYTRHGEVGDLKDQRFVDWFRSQEKRENYENFDARTCHTCQFNSKNETINYMLESEPLHVNFV